MKDCSRRETRCELEVSSTWRGDALAEASIVHVSLEHQGDLIVEVDAPRWPEPAPGCAPGRVPELWRYSVAELFIWGGEDRYLELELGPSGHWWLLELETWRKRCREDLSCDVSVAGRGARWSGRARLSAELLPARPWRLSACAIWGQGEQRWFAMSQPTSGERPDFHQPSAFGNAW